MRRRPTHKNGDAQEWLRAAGATIVPVDLDDLEAVAAGCAGSSCVVSALGGLRDVIVDRQTVLLDAAVKAGVPHFISSDYSADHTKIVGGGNRNFDLRREFMGRADRAPISVTSIFNGAFMDMLGAEMPIIQPRIRRVLYWGDRRQPLDLTTRNDVAAYTARVALDETAPRILRVAGVTVTVDQIAAAMSDITGRVYRTIRVGSLGSLGLMIRATQRIAPQKDAVFPAWQGMQYVRDQFIGLVQLTPLDNDRYPDLGWTPLRTRLVERFGPGPRRTCLRADRSDRPCDVQVTPAAPRIGGHQRCGLRLVGARQRGHHWRSAHRD